MEWKCTWVYRVHVLQVEWQIVRIYTISTFITLLTILFFKLQEINKTIINYHNIVAIMWMSVLTAPFKNSTTKLTTDNKGSIRTKAFTSICVHAIYTGDTCGCAGAADAIRWAIWKLYIILTASCYTYFKIVR